MKNIHNIEYMTIDELISSVELDFKRYAEANLIDIDTIYQVIAYCNSQVGVQISPIKYITADIIHGKANLPENFQKIRTIHIISNFKVPTSLPFYKGWVEHTTEQPKPQDPTFTPMGCMNDCGTCYWVVPHRKEIHEHLIFTHREELCQSNHTGHLRRDEFRIDFDEEIIEFGLHTGKVFMCYYEDPTKLDLIPKHPLLFPWWSWSVRAKILQDVLMNSEEDSGIQVKLQYAERQRDLSFSDVDAFIKSRSYKQMTNARLKHECDFYEKWFSNIM